MSYIDIFLSTKNAILKLKNLFWRKSVNEMYNLVKDNISFYINFIKESPCVYQGLWELTNCKNSFLYFAFLYMNNNLYKSKWLLTVVVHVAHSRIKDFKDL